MGGSATAPCSSTDTQPVVRAVSRRGGEGEMESQQHCSQLGRVQSQRRHRPRAQWPGLASKRKGARGRRQERPEHSRGPPSPRDQPQSLAESGRSRERPGARLAGRAGTLGGSVAGLEWLTHMVRRSVPALCLNPYAAGGKLPPPTPSTLP